MTCITKLWQTYLQIYLYNSGVFRYVTPIVCHDCQKTQFTLSQMRFVSRFASIKFQPLLQKTNALFIN